MAEGYFSQDIVQGAVNNEVSDFTNKIKNALMAKDKDEAKEYKKIIKGLLEKYPKEFVEKMLGEVIVEEEDETEDKEKSLYSMDDYYKSIVGRDEATAYTVKEDIIRTAVANGKGRDEAEANFRSSFVSTLRTQYEKGGVNPWDSVDMLVKYGEVSEEDAESKVQYWDFKKAYPDYDLTESAVSKYYEYAEPEGISVSVYYDYTKKRSAVKGTDNDGDGRTDSGSVKAGVLKVIDSLPITSSQKDALFYLNGWSASTLWEAPWR